MHNLDMRRMGERVKKRKHTVGEQVHARHKEQPSGACSPARGTLRSMDGGEQEEEGHMKHGLLREMKIK